MKSRNLLVWCCTLCCLAIPAMADCPAPLTCDTEGDPARPLSYCCFEPIEFVPGSVPRVLTPRAVNMIQCGCDDVTTEVLTDCSACVAEETDTFLYFPIEVDGFGNPIPYALGWSDGQTSHGLVIDRTKSLFLAGLDARHSRITSMVPGEPMFTVEKASLINVTRMNLWPDTQVLQHEAGIFHFDNMLPVTFEMLDTFLTSGEVVIEGPGTYRVQNVSGNTQAMTRQMFHLNHEDADLTMVGGHLQATPNSVDPALGAYGWLPSSCAPCDGPNPPIGCPHNPCSDDIYHVLQDAGRLRMFSTAFTTGNGVADVRLSKGADEPHILANIRSEGSGSACGVGFPSSFVDVAPDDPGGVDVLIMASEGSWVHEGPNCAAETDQQGKAHFADFNGPGTLWLVGNISDTGVGRLVVGEPRGTVVAYGNRYFGNTDNDGSDPTRFFPEEGFCNWPPYGVCDESTDCPKYAQGEQCESPNYVYVGNMYSAEYFCDWRLAQEGGTMCTDVCTPTECAAFTLFSNPNRRLTDEYAYIPEIPDTDVPLPLTVPPVLSPLQGMIDADVCRSTPYDCLGYFPDDCVNWNDFRCANGDECDDWGTCSEGPCVPAPEFNPQEDHCWLQAAFNKATTARQPVFIPAPPPLDPWYYLSRPLYWQHYFQDDYAYQLPQHREEPWGAVILSATGAESGGWIVGENNSVRLFNADGPAFATQGMSRGVIQGIRFQSTTVPPPSTTYSVVEIENDHNICGTWDERCIPNTDDCGGNCGEITVGYATAHIVFHDCDVVGGTHALGICLESAKQCDTIMTVNGTFSDAEIGWANGGQNALHNIAYNATMERNRVAFGFDEDPEVTIGSGSFSVLHADISGTTQDKDINLRSDVHPFYFYGVTSDNPLLLDETFGETTWSVIFDDSQLNIGHPVGGPSLVRFGQAGGVFFVNDTDIGNGVVELPDGNPATSKVGFLTSSDGPHWTPLEVYSPQRGRHELEFCDTEFCGGVEMPWTCTTTPDPGDHRFCLDRGAEAWFNNCGTGEVYGMEQCTYRNPLCVGEHPVCVTP